MPYSSEITDEYEVVIFVGNRLDSIRLIQMEWRSILASNNEPGAKLLHLLISQNALDQNGKLRGNSNLSIIQFF